MSERLEVFYYYNHYQLKSKHVFVDKLSIKDNASNNKSYTKELDQISTLVYDSYSSIMGFYPNSYLRNDRHLKKVLRSFYTVERLAIVVLIILLIILAGCTKSNKNTQYIPAETGNTDTINNVDVLNPYQLSEDEKEIVDLIVSGGSSVNIYNYSLNNRYSKISLWFDEYQKGNLVYSSMPLTCNVQDYKDGKVSIIIGDGDTIQLSIKNGNSTTKCFDQLHNNGIDQGNLSFWENTSGISNEQIISPGSEKLVLIYASNSNNIGNLREPDYFLQNPDKVENYDYMYFFKCSFNE